MNDSAPEQIQAENWAGETVIDIDIGCRAGPSALNDS
jgi:hypothetical protein